MKRAGGIFLYDCLQLLLGLGLWGVLLAWGPSGVLSPVIGLPSGSLVEDPRVHLLILGALFLASWAAVRVKFRLGGGYFVSFDIAFATAAFFLLSPAAGAALAVSTICVDFIYRLRGKAAEAGLAGTFCGNLGNRLIRFGFVWLVFGVLRGPGVSPCFGAAPLPSLAAFGAYFAANNLFYVPKEWLKGVDMAAYWRETFTEDLIHSFAICATGWLLALVAAGVGLGPAALLGGFVLSASWLLSQLMSAQAELKVKLEDLTILSKVSAAASSDLDVMPMAGSFARALAESLPVDGIGVVFSQRYSTAVNLVQVEGGKSRSAYLNEEMREHYAQLSLNEPSERLGQRLFEFLQPLETAPFFIPASVFGLPLLQGGETFGGIVVYAYKDEVPLSRYGSLLETCAQTLVVAFQNCALHLQAIQDPLTGLYNRSYFLYRLEEELAYSSRHHVPFALLMLDLDDFKAVNDRLGHSQGDKVMTRIGDLIRNAIRREDVPARFGGDEFVILVLNCPPADAAEKAERVRALLSARALPKEEAYGLSLGCSVGFIHSEDLAGDQDVPSILRRLDRALYVAKERGKNQVVRAE